MKIEGTKGITLIALIITVILLVILAGTVISTLNSGNIFDNAISVVEQSKIASKKEEIELAIIGKMNASVRELTIDSIIETLEKKGIVDEGNSNSENGQVKTNPDGYIYEITEKPEGSWEVKYIGKGTLDTTKVKLNVELSTTGITDKVIMTVTAKAKAGIKSITMPDGSTKTYTGTKTEVSETYEATQNGEYTFTATTNKGDTESKTITIDNIIEGTIEISAEPSEPTNKSVTVTIVWPSGSENLTKEISSNGGEKYTVVNGTKTTLTLNSNCVVKARVKNSVSEIKTAVLNVINIDKTNPTVTAKQETVTIKEGDSNEISNYFTVIANGTYGIANTVCIDTSNNNTVVTNTNTLKVGTHTIKCTVTKQTGATASASITVIVESKMTNPVINGVTVSEVEEGLKIDVDAISGDETVLGPQTLTFPKNNWPNEFGELTNPSSTYGFEEYEGTLRSTNYNINSSASDAYYKIDLTKYDSTKTFPLTVNATISSESTSYDYAYITAIKGATNGAKYYDYNSYSNLSNSSNGVILANKIGGTTETTKDYTGTLTGGEEYYLHFYYRKDSSGNEGIDRLVINNITIDGLSAPGNYEYNINNSGYSEKTTNNSYTYSSANVPDVNTITVRVTNEGGKQTSKTITYVKGITIVPDHTRMDGTPVKVSVNFPTGNYGGTKQIKIGENDWKPYTGSENITNNCTVRARVYSQDGTVKGEEVFHKVWVTGALATDVAEDASYIGKYVNYDDPSGDPDVKWRIFYADSDNIYLIANDYLNYDYVPTKTKNETTYQMTKINDYKAKITDMYNAYTGSEDITDTRITKWMKWLERYPSSTNYSIRCVDYLLDTEIWKNQYQNNYAEYAIGGPTIEMFCASYKATHPSKYIQCDIINDYGYYLKWNDDGNYLSGVTDLSKSELENLYVISDDSKAMAYWIASPSSSRNNIINVGCYGHINAGYASNKDLPGLRAVICLKSNVQLVPTENENTYDLKLTE